MAGERTVPLLPCADIDEVADFLGVLGFGVTHHQTRPNPYLVVGRDDMELHYFGLDDFDPQDSYGSCLIFVDDTGHLYEQLAQAMRTAYGKVLVSGLPRVTRPRRRKNTGKLSGFSIIDPGGNWLRVFEHPDRARDRKPSHESPSGVLNQRLETAVVLGDAKGDAAQAAQVLDTALQNHRSDARPVELLEALAYRAELAMVTDEPDLAAALLTEIEQIQLDPAEREQASAALARAQDLREANAAT